MRAKVSGMRDKVHLIVNERITHFLDCLDGGLDMEDFDRLHDFFVDQLVSESQDLEDHIRQLSAISVELRFSMEHNSRFGEKDDVKRILMRGIGV
jgi:hypothetical protein